MFRRTIVRSLAISVALLSLGAATTSQAQEKLPYGLKAGKPHNGTTLNVMLVGTSQFKGIELRAEEFTKLTGIKVTWSEVTFKALQEKVSTVGVAADGAVDVVNYLDSWGPPNAHWFVPLDDRLKRDGISMDRYPAAFAKTSTFNGKVMGLPMRSHVQLFFYRKDIFDELKLSAPQTWEDVVRAGQVIKKAKPGIGPLACYFGADGTRQNLYVWVNFLWGAGVKIFDAKGQPAWDSPAGIQATKDYIALNTTEKICADGAVSMVEQEARIVFMQGKAAMLPIWWWAYSPLTNPSRSHESRLVVRSRPGPHACLTIAKFIAGVILLQPIPI
jgi:multiple sugar transport system substrate-binding protein